MRFLLSALPLFLLYACGLVAAQQYAAGVNLNGTCSGASGVAADPRSGTLFAGCSTGNSVQSWSSITATPTVLLASGNGCVYPEDLYWSPARNSLFVACNGYPSSSAAVIQITNGTSTILPASYSGCGLHYVHVDVDNSVYASCDTTGVLKWTDTTKNAVKLSDGGNCQYSRQLAINPVTGDIFLACIGGFGVPGQIVRWAPGATTASTFYTCDSAQGAVIAANGDLYVGCGTASKVVKFAFNAGNHQYSTIGQQLNGTCAGSGGVNLQWASNGLLATCVSESALKFWSLSALNSNFGPTVTIGTGTGANVEFTPYGETILSANFNTGKVTDWQLLP